MAKLLAEPVVVHVVAPCLRCGEAVHLVVDAETAVGRWCCLACGVSGLLPCNLDGVVARPPPRPAPTPSA